MIEVLKQLVDALENPTLGLVPHGGEWRSIQSIAIQAGKQAIAEWESQEQNFCPRCGKRLGGEDSIHTCTPPQRTWVGLTDEEAQWLYNNCRTPGTLIDMVEAKLKEKNT